MGRWSDALSQARDQQEQQKTRKALKSTPSQAPYIYTTTTTQSELMSLLSHGWEVVSSNPLSPVLGTSIFTKTLLRKPNPLRLDTAS